MLAVIRRGPFAEPTESERVEYLFTRVKKDRVRTDFENYALEHVLSYQRRVVATKEAYMKRNKLTPLGITTDWWDRTEAQMRAALHAHILCWFRRRRKPDNYVPLSPGQRRVGQTVEPLSAKQHDHVYHQKHMFRQSPQRWFARTSQQTNGAATHSRC